MIATTDTRYCETRSNISLGLPETPRLGGAASLRVNGGKIPPQRVLTLISPTCIQGRKAGLFTLKCRANYKVLCKSNVTLFL